MGGFWGILTMSHSLGLRQGAGMSRLLVPRTSDFTSYSSLMAGRVLRLGGEQRQVISRRSIGLVAERPKTGARVSPNSKIMHSVYPACQRRRILWPGRWPVDKSLKRPTIVQRFVGPIADRLRCPKPERSEGSAVLMVASHAKFVAIRRPQLGGIEIRPILWAQSRRTFTLRPLFIAGA